MTDPAFFQSVSDQSPFRQGDIIRREISSAGFAQAQNNEWGVIITADCDIAQDKMGEFFTYLVIRSARDYVENIWAADEVDKVRDRCSRLAIEQIHQFDRLRDPDASPLKEIELLDWALVDGANQILDTVGIKQTAARKKIGAAIELMTLVDERKAGFATALERLKACWARDGKKEPEQRGFIQNALKQRQMRIDYMLTPTLPSESEIGFVVMLREVRAVRTSDLFPTQLDLRIGNGGTAAMYRIGRFSDFIRYAIAQRMANLFSRIGMTENFEAECEIAASFVLEALLPTAMESGD